MRMSVFSGPMAICSVYHGHRSYRRRSPFLPRCPINPLTTAMMRHKVYER
jgi:hypothetical protein